MCQACSDKKNRRLSQTFGGIEFAFCVSKWDIILIYFMDILSEKGSRTQKLIFRKRQSFVRYTKINRGRSYAPTKAGFAIRPIVSLTNVPSVASNQNIAPFGNQTMCCVF